MWVYLCCPISKSRLAKLKNAAMCKMLFMPVAGSENSKKKNRKGSKIYENIHAENIRTNTRVVCSSVWKIN